MLTLKTLVRRSVVRALVRIITLLWIYNIKQLDNAKSTFKLRMEHKRLASDIIIVCRTYV